MKPDVVNLAQAGARIRQRAEEVHEGLNNRELWQLLPVQTLIQFGEEYHERPLTAFMQAHYSHANRPPMSNKQLNIVALALIQMIGGEYTNILQPPKFHPAADEMENNKDKENFFGLMFMKILTLTLIALDIEFTFGQLEDGEKPSRILGHDAMENLFFFRMMTSLVFGMNIVLLSGYMNGMHPANLKDFEKEIKRFAPRTEAEKQYLDLLNAAHRELAGETKASLFNPHVYFTNLNWKIEKFLKPVFYGAGAYQAFNLSPALAPLIPLAYIVKLNNDQSTWKEYGQATLSFATYAYVALLTYNLDLLDSLAKNYVNGTEDEHEFQTFFKASVASCVGLLSMAALNQGYKFLENPVGISNAITATVSNGVRNTMSFAYDRLFGNRRPEIGDRNQSMPRRNHL